MGTPAARSPVDVDVPNRTIAGTYDRLSAFYDRVVTPLEAPTRDRAIDRLSPAAGESVLEVGCGTGRALVAIARRVGASGRVVGLDAAAGMSRRSRRRVRRAGLDDCTAVVLGDARELPVASGTMDAVYSAETLELFSRAEVRSVLAEVRRVLRADGRLCVASMNRTGHEGSAFVRAYEWIYRTVPGYSRLGCRPIDVAAVLEDGGFEVETVEEHVRWGGWPTAIVVARPERT